MMQALNLNRRTLSVILAVALSGCTTYREVRQTEAAVHETEQQLKVHAASMSQQHRPIQGDTVVFSDRPIVSLRPLPVDRAKAVYPEYLQRNLDFAPQEKSLPLLEFAQRITRITGVNVKVTPDAISALYGNSSGNPAQGNNAVLPPVGMSLPSLPALPAGPDGLPMDSMPVTAAPSPRGGQGYVSHAERTIAGIRWDNKPLRGLLDVVANRLNLSWRAENGGVTIFYLDSKTFDISSLPSVDDMQSVVQSGSTATVGAASGTNGGSGGSSSGGITGQSGSMQSTSVSMRSSLLDDLKDAVKNLLTPGLGRVSVSAFAGEITVTDTPDALRRVETYMNGIDRTFAKQVVLDIKVLSVSKTRGSNLAIDWNAIYKTVSGYNFGWSAPQNIATGAASATIGVLGSATSGTAANLAGSSLIVSALNQVGHVRTVTAPTIRTANLQSVPIQVAKQTTYKAQVGQTNVAQVGSTVSITPGVVTTGFFMNLKPKILANNDVVIRYTINMSSLVRLRTIGEGESAIEAPEVTSRVFANLAKLRTGETLVLSGFEQTSDNATRQGVGHPDNIVLGGGVGNTSDSDVLVVLITPTVTD